MRILFEQPGTILIVGLLAEAIAVTGLVKTGRREALWAAIALPIVIVLLLGLERYAVTDREQIRDTIGAMARDVERNDLPALLEHLSERHPEVRQRAAADLPRYEFSDISVKSNLTIEIRESNIPPKAIATFNVTATVSQKSGYLSNHKVASFVKLTFYKEGDRWRVGEYSYDNPMRGM